MDRRPIVIANWKMYLDAAATLRAARATRVLVARAAARVDIVLCPSFPLIPSVVAAVKGSRIRVGAQDVHAELRGPYTGDVSAEHLRGLVRYVIIGHSERRRQYGETDDIVARKFHQALHAGLQPIVCVGETADERDAGDTVAVVRRQVHRVLAGMPALSLARCVFAYEPVWAVRSNLGAPGAQPAPDDAAQVMGLIRKVAADRAGRRYAERLRVVYGGSVDAKTAKIFVAEPHVDGVLVGASSTNPVALHRIIREVLACHS